MHRRTAALIPTFALLGALALAGCSSTTTAGAAPAADDAPVAAATEEAPAAPAPGTREAPLPIGSTVESSDWSVTVNSVTLGATDAVIASSPINAAADPGTEYIMVNYSATYTGSDADGQLPAFVQINYVTGAGVTINMLDKFLVTPDAINSTAPLYNGATATGNVALQVPSPVDGVLVVQPGMIADKSFVAVQ